MPKRPQKGTDRRFHCRAVIARFGTKEARGRLGWVRTIMLQNIVEVGTDNLIAKQQWLTKGEWALNLKLGDIITFDIGAKRERDHWRLTRPTKVTRLSRKPQESPTAPLQAIQAPTLAKQG